MAPFAPSGDCELIDTSGAAQDVNAWSSLAYIVAGAAVLIAVARRRLTSVAWLLAALLVAEGAGSAWFHGTTSDSDVAQWLHDVPFIGVLGVMAGWHVGRIAGRGDVGGWVGGIATMVIAGALQPVGAWAVNVTAAVLIAAIVGGELVARVRRQPLAIRAGLVVVVAIAVLLYVLGRSDAPLCDPDSVAQPHGAWHLLTALAVFMWADRALATAGPGEGSGVGRSITDTVVGGVAVALVRAFHHGVDVSGREHVPADRPVLVVANHGNGFVDPVVLAAAVHRLPRFIAKAALWKVVPARPFLDGLAVLPVHRRSDGDDPGENDRTFEACHDALRRREMVAIFPEGTTGDRAHLDTVRTGAARIALGARGDGVDEITIVPVGLAFESRVETRTRAAVTFGPALDLDEWSAREGVGRAGASDRPAVTALTEEIRTSLEAVSPVYASVDEREQLRLAAAIALRAERPHGRAPRFGDIERRASHLADAPAAARADVVDALADHALRGTLTGVGDDLAGGVIRGLGRIAGVAIALLLLGSIVVPAFLVHVPCVLAVRFATSLVTSTATKGTVRILVGLVTAVLTWWIVGIVVADGVGPVLLAMLATAAAGALALATWSYLVQGVSAVVHAVRVRDRRQLVRALDASRDRLVEAVHVAEAAVPSAAPPGDRAAAPPGGRAAGRAG